MKKITKTLDIVLIILGLLLVAFITTMIVLFANYQSVPDTLIEQVLDTGKFELIAMAAITIVKTIMKGKSKKSLENSNDFLEEGDEEELNRENFPGNLEDILEEVMEEETEMAKKKKMKVYICLPDELKDKARTAAKKEVIARYGEDFAEYKAMVRGKTLVTYLKELKDSDAVMFADGFEVDSICLTLKDVAEAFGIEVYK